MACSNLNYRIHKNLICGKADTPNVRVVNDLINILFGESCFVEKKVKLRVSALNMYPGKFLQKHICVQVYMD